MHKYERIALWTLVILTFLIVVFRPSVSGWTGTPSSIFDVAEFNAFPANLASALKTNGQSIIGALAKKSTKDWQQLPVSQQNMILTNMKNASDRIINNINSGMTIQTLTAPPPMPMPMPPPPMPMPPPPMPMPPPPMPMPPPSIPMPLKTPPPGVSLFM